jgi:transcriptional regulator of acetoin/glycerol metabolism
LQKFSQEELIALSQEYREAWKKMAGGETVISLPDMEILKSWQRCQQYGVPPTKRVVEQVLNADEIQQLRNKNKLFLDVSMPTLETLYHFVAGSGFVVALSDCNGFLLEVFGDDDVRDAVRAGNWVPGACWSEQGAGTNIIGTTLYRGQPLSLRGYEHFCKCCHRFEGVGAPIHESDGSTIGIVSLTGAVGDAHSHTLGMVVAAANAIEIQLAMKKAWQACDLANQHKNIIVNSIYDGLFVTDSAGIICLVNQRVLEILNLRKENLIGSHIGTLFSQAFIKTLQSKDVGKFIDQAEEISNGKNKVKCIVTCRSIVQDGKANGLVFVVNEMARAKRLAGKLYSNDARYTFDTLIGKSSNFLSIVEMAKLFAPTKSNVLLLGESGTGKDVFAQSIHNASFCNNGPFIAVNCGAIPKELIESELFGYSEGAFTGALKGGKMGKFELADGGTLFLDEIGEMPFEQQKVFLRVLEDRKITRLGGREVIPINVRIIASTNADLEQEVKKGAFRHDLYYRLNVYTIKMLPLRARKEDIKLLANVFLTRLADSWGRPTLELSEDIWDLLINYDWPGNIRELQNAIERAFVLGDGRRITSDLFMFQRSNVEHCESKHYTTGQMQNVIKSSLQEREAEMFRNVLLQNNWNISKTSIQLGVSRTTLYRKMGVLGIKIPREFRNAY